MKKIKCEYIDCPGQQLIDVFLSPGDWSVHSWCYIEALGRKGTIEIRKDIEK